LARKYWARTNRQDENISKLLGNAEGIRANYRDKKPRGEGDKAKCGYIA